MQKMFFYTALFLSLYSYTMEEHPIDVYAKRLHEFHCLKYYVQIQSSESLNLFNDQINADSIYESNLQRIKEIQLDLQTFVSNQSAAIKSSLSYYTYYQTCTFVQQNPIANDLAVIWLARSKKLFDMRPHDIEMLINRANNVRASSNKKDTP